MEKEIPEEIKVVLDAAAKTYSDSKATTDAGVVLRLLSRLFKPSTIIKLFAYKLT